jgi:hypothetical protein
MSGPEDPADPLIGPIVADLGQLIDYGERGLAIARQRLVEADERRDATAIRRATAAIENLEAFVGLHAAAQAGIEQLAARRTALSASTELGVDERIELAEIDAAIHEALSERDNAATMHTIGHSQILIALGYGPRGVYVHVNPNGQVTQVTVLLASETEVPAVEEHFRVHFPEIASVAVSAFRARARWRPARWAHLGPKWRTKASACRRPRRRPGCSGDPI